MSTSRAVCYRCHKPAVVCICAGLQQVRNRTGIIVLQHPQERFHPIGTVRFARLGLENARVIVDEPARPPLTLPPRTGLLFPSPEARDLADVPPEARPGHLLVLDGTWPQARGLYRRNPWLGRLPHFRAPPREGQYRIRREPHAYGLSTIEAIVAALEVLEPDTAGLGQLLEAFSRMIDRQIEYARVPTPRARRRRAEPGPRRLDPGLAPERIVLGYGEFDPSVRGSGPPCLLYWSAVHLASGATFEGWVRPDHELSDRQLQHAGLARADLEAGELLESLAARWAAFLGAEGVLAAWNQSTLDCIASGPLRARRTLLLKAAYCNWRRRQCGALDAVLAAEGLAPMAVPFAGRAGRVMARLLPAARRLAESGVLQAPRGLAAPSD